MSQSLREFQRQMKARISARRHPELPPPLLAPQRGTPGVERLAVYAEGYVVRMREALSEVYEAIAHLLDAAAFQRLAFDYARAHPSREYNLSFAGRHLPDFLPRWPTTADLPFLPDLARLEWAVCDAFHAFEQPPLEAARLSSLTLEEWASVQLRFQPSVRVVSSAWPILDLWQARTAPRQEIDILLVDRPQHVLVFRQGTRVRCEQLEPQEANALSALLTGECLGGVCERLAKDAGEAPPIGAWCARWAGAGLFAGLQRTVAS